MQDGDVNEMAQESHITALEAVLREMLNIPNRTMSVVKSQCQSSAFKELYDINCAFCHGKVNSVSTEHTESCPVRRAEELLSGKRLDILKDEREACAKIVESVMCFPTPAETKEKYGEGPEHMADVMLANAARAIRARKTRDEQG